MVLNLVPCIRVFSRQLSINQSIAFYTHFGSSFIVSSCAIRLHKDVLLCDNSLTIQAYFHYHTPTLNYTALHVNKINHGAFP